MDKDIQMLEAILDGSNQMVQVSDAQTYNILYANLPARVFSGHENEPYGGRHCYEYMMGRQEPCLYCPLRRQEAGDTYETEVNNGQQIFSVRIKKILWHGRPAFIEYAWDITALRNPQSESQEALKHALVAAERANKAKTTFLNNMSHDIRTPMNAIIGFTALAATHIDNQELVQGYLQKITVSSTHLLSLINDVLDMSRIESGRVKIEEKNVHIPDVLHDLRTIIQGNVAAKRQDLYIDTQDVVHEDIITDKLRLNQVLLNLVSNAIKFTPAGGTIEVKSEEGKGSEFIVCLSCRVSGRVMRYEPVPQLRGARALVVDDDTNTCMSVSKMLRGIEMRPDWTTSGKEAVIRLRRLTRKRTNSRRLSLTGSCRI